MIAPEGYRCPINTIMMADVAVPYKTSPMRRIASRMFSVLIGVGEPQIAFALGAEAGAGDRRDAGLVEEAVLGLFARSGRCR